MSFGGYGDPQESSKVQLLAEALRLERGRNQADIAELVAALKNVLPEVSVCGLPGQLEMIRALIAKHTQPIKEQ